MSLLSVIQPYDIKSEEAGECHFYARFTVGATGAVPAGGLGSAGWTRLSQSITSVVRLSAGKYKYIFDGFFVPGYSAANQAGQMGSGLGASPMIAAGVSIVGANGTPGTNATGGGRVIADNTNNQDTSGVCFITVEFDVGATPTDPAANDEVLASFVLKTERP